MRSGAMWRLFMFILAVGSDLVLAGFSATDQPVAVTVEQKTLSALQIGSCMSSKATYNVRINSIKSKTTKFSRVLMEVTAIEKYASKLGNGTAKHIGDCAEMADVGGFVGFTFIGGLCKMFIPGRQPCRCDVGTGDLIYVQDSFWDKKDSIMNKLVDAGGELMEYVHFPSTVVDQLVNLNMSIYFSDELLNPSDDELMTNKLSKAPGFNAILCNGKSCHTSFDVDTAHCSMGCNTSSNWVVRRQFTHQQRVIDEIAPRKYFLSECGNTITTNWTFLEERGSARLILMSHKGFGCQWYPKDASDVECVVSFVNTKRHLSFEFYKPSLDGNPSTCEGDSITFYNGTPAAKVFQTKITPCDNKLNMRVDFPFGDDAVVVFKRSARQYRSDGFNFGFFIDVSS